MNIEQSVLLLCLAMVLAIGIERLLELIRAISDHLEARSGNTDKWDKRAKDIRDRIEVRLNNARVNKRTSLKAVLLVVCRYLSPATAESGGLMTISADTVRSMHIKIRFKLLAIILGIGFACLFQLDIFELVDKSIYGDVGSGKKLPPPLLGIIITGISMGFGAGPVHKFISALERARKKRR